MQASLCTRCSVRCSLPPRSNLLGTKLKISSSELIEPTYIENSDGNTNVRFHQADTHKRFFALLESKGIRANRFRADCGSCSKEIISEIEKHCRHFYIRANRCSSLYNDIFALRGWKTEEINGIQGN